MLPAIFIIYINIFKDLCSMPRISDQGLCYQSQAQDQRLGTKAKATDFVITGKATVFLSSRHLEGSQGQFLETHH